MQDYDRLIAQLESLFEGEAHWLPNLSNAAAAIYGFMPDLNWAGFYLLMDGVLVLGPFQGKPACIRIPLGRGVCGVCAKTKQVQRVADVHAFPGHIACDGASNSEIVLPLIHEGRILGVLDLDSPLYDRFSEADQRGLEDCARVIARVICGFEGDSVCTTN